MEGATKGLDGVLSAVARTAARLCEAKDCRIYLTEGDRLRLAVQHGVLKVRHGGFGPGETRPISRRTALGLAILERRTVHVRDMVAAARRFPESPAARGVTGVRTLLVAPLFREGTAIGGIVIRRTAVRPFSLQQIRLLQAFADQAVIAIENIRLVTELQARNRDLTEALERQTATSEILRVISRSPTALQPALAAMAESAARLCAARDVIVLLREDDRLVSHAHVGAIPLDREVPLVRDSLAGRAVLDRRPIHIEDLSVSDDIPIGREFALRQGFRTGLAVPLLRQDAAIGVILVRRAEARRFTDLQVALLQTFADQAVIAIENVRLFTELQTRNRELTEALEQQTATSEILGVLSSSPTDVQPVFDTIADSAARLCEAFDAIVLRVDGDVLRLVAHHGPMPAGDVPLHRGTLGGRTVLERRLFHIEDLQAEGEHFPEGSAIARQRGHRTTLSVPLMREGSAIGNIQLRRNEVRPFSDKHIALLQTFAAQAVIAIENVRLFAELQARNRELTEALDRQTATAEILRVISSSPTDVQPVFDTIVRSASRLCGADFGGLHLLDGDRITLEAHYNARPGDYEAWQRIFPLPLGRGTASGRAVASRAPVQITDVQADPEFSTAVSALEGHRTVVAVPMLREAIPIGTIVAWRREVRPFTDPQVEMLRTFADQAVIAIENVRLFDELQRRTEALSRSVDQLRALGDVSQALGSTLDLEAVLSTIVERASQLAGTDGCTVFEYDESAEQFHLRATYGLGRRLTSAVRTEPIRKGEGAVGRLALSLAPIQIPDIAAEGAYQGRLRASLLEAGQRAMLAIPLLREQRLLGGFTVSVKTPGTFARETVALLQTFATQSALAIHNARLFREIADKSRQLEEASRHKSQFLASMSHELRTPLNAILGYTELIADNIYGEVPERMREVMERVDKSGRHLLGLINDVLDLSKIEAGQLTLALSEYLMSDMVQSVAASVGSLAAEKKLELVITVDPDLPVGRGDPRRLTQVLLNLVGNAIKFTETGRVAVDARQDGGAFRVAVTDTGPGIAPRDQERIFEEFQQVPSTSAGTKGGTGLGLAIARRIVQMHGGRLWVESAVGQGATFSFTIPVRVEAQAGAAES